MLWITAHVPIDSAGADPMQIGWPVISMHASNASSLSPSCTRIYASASSSAHSARQSICSLDES